MVVVLLLKDSNASNSGPNFKVICTFCFLNRNVWRVLVLIPKKPQKTKPQCFNDSAIYVKAYTFHIIYLNYRMTNMKFKNVEVVSESNAEGSEYSASPAILRIQLGFCSSSE